MELEIDPIEELKKLLTKFNTKTKLARHLGVSTVFVCDIFNGSRRPGPKICKALNIERVVIYRRINHAVTHRDGGEYTGIHGIEKSVEDAQQIIADAVVK
jgi:hypothetical protein